MISCTLGDKKYTIDYVTGRALREMEPAAKMYAKIVAVSNAAVKGEAVETDGLTIGEAMDVMIKWFCVLFGNQFTPDDVLDLYPADNPSALVSISLIPAAASLNSLSTRFSDLPMVVRVPCAFFMESADSPHRVLERRSA